MAAVVASLAERCALYMLIFTQHSNEYSFVCHGSTSAHCLIAALLSPLFAYYDSVNVNSRREKQKWCMTTVEQAKLVIQYTASQSSADIFKAPLKPPE